MEDTFDLERFVEAQRPIFPRVLAELREGRKRSHWMWFVFPQILGLGGSPMSVRYAIGSLEEAVAYLVHPVLGPRLREVTTIVARIDGSTATDVFGRPDDMKFRSSMTLFARAAPNDLFDEALARFFAGKPDPATLARLP